ncbi:MAG TPA: translocation/assembly module TamB domain-containing protein [Candidatus Babeliales bacterium]|nr:translocation/assembly module TamB domain-containing protein [Candidatus Babeliales bacterium]
MVKKIFFALLLGIFGVIFFAQYDTWTHKKIIILLQKIAQNYLGSNFLCTIESINFFYPSLILNDVEMRSVDSDAWVWRCKKCEITCSWIQLLCKGSMDQYVIINEFECTSRVDNFYLAIESHFMSMMQKSLLPFSVELKSIIFKNSHFYAYDEAYNSEISLFFNSSSLRIGHQIKTMMSIVDGQIKYNKENYIENITTDVSFSIEYIDDKLNVESQVAGAFVLSHMANQGGCYITGGWKSDRGRFSVRNAYSSLVIDPIIITERELRINAHFPLPYVARCCMNSITDQAVDGTMQCSVKICRGAECTVDGQIVIEDVKFNNYHMCDAGKIIFGRHNNEWKMRLALTRYNQEYTGVGYWDEHTKKGEFIVKNITEIYSHALSQWRVKPHKFFAHFIAEQGSITSNYETIITNTLSDEQRCLKGNFSFAHNLFIAQGLLDQSQFFVDMTILPQFVVNQCSYKDKEEKQLIMIQSMNDNQHILGSISFPFIRSLINDVLHYDIQAEGSIDVDMQYCQKKIFADITLHDATIRLPQTYNFVDGCNVHCVYDMVNGLAVLENLAISLHTGNVNCLRATASFDKYGSLVFAHAPIILDHCLLNIKQDLFAIISGNLLFSKVPSSSSRVVGNIIIDKAQLKENLFSGVIQNQLLSYTHSVFSFPHVSLQCDLGIETESPICVDTGFLQTNAQVNLRIQKDTQDPSVVGSVILNSGILKFPYKPLYISKGVITFFPGQLFDPTIELVARNKIKKYDVILQVEGSLLTHHIALDATPLLSEEQIVGLLLVGAEENSLNSMMPALIVQNLKSFIFSNNQSSFFDKYFKPLLGSFNINLVPSFTDQTGRGGLRGALEIAVDDRWHAIIQKNFSLTEDTKFELEFFLSDDITLRAIRDERRDLGGEVEMRWKF